VTEKQMFCEIEGGVWFIFIGHFFLYD